MDNIVQKQELNLLDFKKNEFENWDVVFQRALDTIKNSYDKNSIIHTLVIPSGEYEITNTCVAENITFNIISHGFLSSKNNVGKILKLNNCNFCDIDLKIKGINHNRANFIKSEEISDNLENIIEVGLQINGGRGNTVNIYAEYFYGRVIEGINCWQNLWKNIKCVKCGQSIYINSNTAFGTIGNVWSEEMTSAFIKATDVTLSYYENSMFPNDNNYGIVFKDCSSLWIDTLNVGNLGQYMINFNNCKYVDGNHLYICGSGTVGGLNILNCSDMNLNLNTQRIKGNVINIEGLTKSKITIDDSYSESLGFIKPSTSMHVTSSKIEINSRRRSGNELIVTRDSDVTNNITDLILSLNCKDRTGTNVNDLKVELAAANITLDSNCNMNKIILCDSNKVTNLSNNISNVEGIFFRDITKVFALQEGIKRTNEFDITSSDFILDTSWKNTITKIDNISIGTICIIANDSTGKSISNGQTLITLDDNNRCSSNYLTTAVYQNMSGSYEIFPVIVEGKYIKSLKELINVKKISFNISHSRW